MISGAMVFRVFIFIYFLFRTNGKKEHLNENKFYHCYCDFSKVQFWKFLDHSCVQSFFSAISRHTHNGIWEALYSWTFFKNGSTYILILSWLNIMERKLTEVPEKLRLAQKSKPVPWRTSQWSRTWYFTYFPTNTPRVFHVEYTRVFIGYCMLFFLASKPSFEI